MLKEIINGIEESYQEQGAEIRHDYAAPCPICKEWTIEDVIVYRLEGLSEHGRIDARRRLLQKYAEHVLSHYNHQTKLWDGEHMFTQQVRIPSIYIVSPDCLPFWQRVKYLLRGEI